MFKYLMWQKFLEIWRELDKAFYNVVWCELNSNYYSEWGCKLAIEDIDDWSVNKQIGFKFSTISPSFTTLC